MMSNPNLWTAFSTRTVKFARGRCDPAFVSASGVVCASTYAQSFFMSAVLKALIGEWIVP